VKRLEEAAAQAKEVGGKQIALLRESLQALGKSLQCIRCGNTFCFKHDVMWCEVSGEIIVTIKYSMITSVTT
jgi:hypothetical protein